MGGLVGVDCWEVRVAAVSLRSARARVALRVGMQTLPKLRRAFLALMDAAIQEPRWLAEMTLPPRFYLILMAALSDGLNNTGPSRETDPAHRPCSSTLLTARTRSFSRPVPPVPSRAMCVSAARCRNVHAGVRDSVAHRVARVYAAQAARWDRPGAALVAHTVR